MSHPASIETGRTSQIVRPKAWLAILIALISLSISAPAASQTITPDTVLNAHRGAVVQLQVLGKVNNKDEFENGTGFLFQTSAGPRIITAGHVVSHDNKWDSDDERCIYYRLAVYGSSQLFECVIDAKVDPVLDLAEIYLDPFAAPTLEMAQALPATSVDLAVASWRSWGQHGSRATAQRATILGVQPEKMILSGNYERSDSGSPVLDSDGKVVGLLIEASNQPGGTSQGIAIPVTKFYSVLSGAIASPIKRAPITILADAINRDAVNKGKGGVLVDAISTPGKPGCIFLGKRSAGATRRAPDMPFGADILQTLRNPDGRQTLLGKALAALVPVNLRADCPRVVEGSAYYAAIRAQMVPGDEITPNEILALNYLDDVFYWARGLARPHATNRDTK
jgi:hypothetical protein